MAISAGWTLLAGVGRASEALVVLLIDTSDRMLDGMLPWLTLVTEDEEAAERLLTTRGMVRVTVNEHSARDAHDMGEYHSSVGRLMVWRVQRS